jgi:hypothetical protein
LSWIDAHVDESRVKNSNPNTVKLAGNKYIYKYLESSENANYCIIYVYAEFALAYYTIEAALLS